MNRKNYSSIFSLVLSLLFPGISLIATAQPWMNQSMVSSSLPDKNESGFQAVSKKFSDYWKTRHPSVREEENAADGSYQQFKRWEWFMGERTYPSGKYFNPEILFHE